MKRVRQITLKAQHASVRPPKDAFRSYVNGNQPADGVLPLTHITDSYFFRDILATATLQPSDCRVFREPLLYMFYGRPAYRVNQQAQSSAIEAYVPVCFILKPSALATLHRVFPFDSGAFEARRLDGAFHNAMIKEDFLLEENLTAPRRLIQLFFGDLTSYYRNRPLSDIKLPPLEHEANCYYGLIRSEQKGDFDERISAIEMQVNFPVPLKDNTLAVVLPDNLADEAVVVANIHSIGAVALPYDYTPRIRPEQYTSEIYSIVRDFYRERGYL